MPTFFSSQFIGIINILSIYLLLYSIKLSKLLVLINSNISFSILISDFVSIISSKVAKFSSSSDEQCSLVHLIFIILIFLPGFFIKNYIKYLIISFLIL